MGDRCACRSGTSAETIRLRPCAAVRRVSFTKVAVACLENFISGSTNQPLDDAYDLPGAPAANGGSPDKASTPFRAGSAGARSKDARIRRDRARLLSGSTPKGCYPSAEEGKSVNS